MILSSGLTGLYFGKYSNSVVFATSYNQTTVSQRICGSLESGLIKTFPLHQHIIKILMFVAQLYDAYAPRDFYMDLLLNSIVKCSLFQFQLYDTALRFILTCSYMVCDQICNVCIKINGSPYQEGWIIKVEMNNPDELKSLMDPDKYSSFCDEEDAKH